MLEVQQSTCHDGPSSPVRDAGSGSVLMKTQRACLLALLLLGGCVRRSEEHTSELQSRGHLVCRLLLEKKITLAWRSANPDTRSQRAIPVAAAVLCMLFRR